MYLPLDVYESLVQFSLCKCGATTEHQTRIVGKGGFWVTSFIYEYETSTTYPLYETMWRLYL